ncbi:MAG: RagB/SusD family nutrient uptake outer membrane protein [Bacteroidetes bacterium]|nr:MAG: RagB/SusD family nutrient uptake outer membrane protein [Bacteroidota bacterium]
MKKAIYITVLMAVFNLTSCKQFLDIKPTDLLTEDVALQTYTDFSTALNGAYGSLTAGAYYGGTFIALGDVTTDNLKFGGASTGLYQFLYNLNYATDSGEFLDFYRQAYAAVYRVNIILSKVDEGQMTDAQKQQIRSECLMIRAIALHDLVRTFARRYDATPDASHEGVPAKTDIGIAPIARNTVKEVYDQIISDISTATPILPTTASPRRFTQRAANALRARVALYMRDWANAEVFATAAITGGPSLSNVTDYPKMWAPEDLDGENIFKLVMARGSSASLGANYWNLPSGVDIFAPTNDIYSLYEPTDIRLTSFFRLHTNLQPDRYVIKKYEGNNAFPGVADIKVLRMSEMYLIRAEARARTSNETGALSDLNALRTARNTNTGTEAGTALISSIMTERRKELFLEGHRWFDLIREQQPMSRTDCNGVTCSLPANNFRFTYPIPQAEIFSNPKMTQNPGY